MTGLACRLVAVIAVLALSAAGPAAAQENLDQGKTAAQLFASDCAICHKSARGLSQGGGLFGLQTFLRAHYTASVQSAAALAAYLQAVDREAPPPRKRTTRRPPKNPPPPKARPKPAEQEKADETKKPARPDDGGEAGRPEADKAVPEKPAETKPADSASAGAKASAPGGESKAASESGAESRSEATSRTAPGETEASAPKAGAGNSVPDIIKPERSN